MYVWIPVIDEMLVCKIPDPFAVAVHKLVRPNSLLCRAFIACSITLRNANATSVAIYAYKSSNCNSALVVTSITMRSPLNNFIILAHKVALTAKTSNEA